jgi:hypothetical protein
VATSRPFAYNIGAPIDGTEQVGNLAIGYPRIGFELTGLDWWMGPDEELGYIIAAENPDGFRAPDGKMAYVQFYMTEFNDSSFISWCEYVSRVAGTPQNFTSANEAGIWLTDNGYFTTYLAPTPTPTPSITPTQTYTQTPQPTNDVTTTPLPPTATPTYSGGATPTPTPTPTSTSSVVSPFSLQFYESGSDVILSFAGQLDLTGLEYVQEFTVNGGGVNAQEGVFGIGPSGVFNVSIYTGSTFTYPLNFGPGGGGPSGPPTGTGDYFGVFNGILPEQMIVVPTGYVSGDYIEGTTTLSGATISSLGMTEGTYNYSWGDGAGQSFDLVIGGVSPEPTPTPTPTMSTGPTEGNYYLVAEYRPASGEGNIVFPDHNTNTGVLNPNTVGEDGFAIYINQFDSESKDNLETLDMLLGRSGTLTLTQGSNFVTYSFTDTAFGFGGAYNNQYWWDNTMNVSPLGTITVMTPSDNDFNTVDPITITIT